MAIAGMMIASAKKFQGPGTPVCQPYRGLTLAITQGNTPWARGTATSQINGNAARTDQRGTVINVQFYDGAASGNTKFGRPNVLPFTRARPYHARQRDTPRRAATAAEAAGQATAA